MKLIIAEKPSVAKAIREALPPNSGYEVTHCVGHLLELAPPGAYSPRWEKWDTESLPIKVKDWKLVPKPKTKDVLATIKSKIQHAKEVVNAGDPDREGQLLVDEVLDYLGWKGPTRRLLLNATDPKSVAKALANIQDNAPFRALSEAAGCRQRADWLIGMNMTRAATKMISSGSLLSIGRVQTPTLALVVRRQKEVDGFVSATFYKLRARFTSASGASIELVAEPTPRVTDPKMANALAAAVNGKSAPLMLKTEMLTRGAPYPYNLASFQKDAEIAYGWTATESLKALQEAYEAKVTSYPRTDCRFLPEEQKDDAVPLAKSIMGAISGLFSLEDEARLGGLFAPSSAVYDNAKVTEHHGLVPTGLVPGSGASERVIQAWKLVSLQFLRSLLPDASVEKTTARVEIPVNGRIIQSVTFSGSLSKTLNEPNSWLAVKGDKSTKARPESEAEVTQMPPGLANGFPMTAARCEPIEAKTSPPQLYTEASLIADMRSVAKYVTDPKLRSRLKETSGIGTAATQANIIETLKERGFIAAKGKKLIATQLGSDLIGAIPPEMADPGVTAAWEDALAMVAKSAYAADLFMQGIERVVDRWLGDLKALSARGVKIATPEAAARPKATGARSAGARRKSTTKR